jgi:hypothetical protein
VITSRSSQMFFEALVQARLDPPARKAEIGERHLDLLIRGIDHELVGEECWYRRILDEAQDVRPPAADEGE